MLIRADNKFREELIPLLSRPHSGRLAVARATNQRPHSSPDCYAALLLLLVLLLNLRICRVFANTTNTPIWAAGRRRHAFRRRHLQLLRRILALLGRTAWDGSPSRLVPRRVHWWRPRSARNGVSSTWLCREMAPRAARRKDISSAAVWRYHCPASFRLCGFDERGSKRHQIGTRTDWEMHRMHTAFPIRARTTLEPDGDRRRSTSSVLRPTPCVTRCRRQGQGHWFVRNNQFSFIKTSIGRLVAESRNGGRHFTSRSDHARRNSTQLNSTKRFYWVELYNLVIRNTVQHYSLHKRRHSLQLPIRTYAFNNNDFLTRMLFNDLSYSSQSSSTTM